MLIGLLGAAPAGAAKAPGKPTAKSPKGTISTATPSFTWSRANRAARYEVRVYEGGTMLLKKTGIKGLAWQSGSSLPTDASLS
jgi:hypothetical protein